MDRQGSLRVPASAKRVGWWVFGAYPGAMAGTVLMVGHVDVRSGELGLFARLDAIRPGAQVDVEDVAGRHHAYVITARRTYKKQEIPPSLFADSGPPRLALVTCTGPYDHSRRTYTKNLVLYGEPR
ncbi:class F sortase [Streptomyces mirabilis]|uniref:class F sortase n=1 Tax=Streptomyces mirabilis TaxID=68239 RepID=UPI0036DE561B